MNSSSAAGVSYASELENGLHAVGWNLSSNQTHEILSRRGDGFLAVLHPHISEN